MNTENEPNKTEKTTQERTDDGRDGETAEPEFKVTVRKLEMPVRPRGVLAE